MSKLTTLKDAIVQHVRDGTVLYCAGFTHLIPFAAGHEIIRQKRRDLTMCRATPDLLYDQMVAAGCARKLIFSWSGNPGVGMLRAVRRAVEAGELAIEEYSHYAMVTRLTAGASRLPFLPMLPVGTDDLSRANPQYRTVDCPYTGQTLTSVPALNPDVTIIHAQRADVEGNAQIWGVIGEQREAAFAAKTVIVTAEEIVDAAVIRADPNRTIVPGFIVDAVCHVPHGAHPSYAQGYYDRDNAFYLQWDATSREPDDLEAWLEAWVVGLSDRDAYWDKLGAETHARLAMAEGLSGEVNYGRF